MPGFIERVKQANLPLDQVVVIGSGRLDALGLRQSRDVDLVVSPPLFDQLHRQDGFKLGHKNQQPYLTKGDYEIWTDWGPNYSFEVLKASATAIEGVWFVSQDILIAKKRQRGSARDLQDIQLLESQSA